MQILNQLETEPIPIEEEEQRHTRRLLIGVLCALPLTGIVFGGYLYLRNRNQHQVTAATELENKKKAAPKVEVFVDEATTVGKKTTLGGTIHNISNEPLRNIAVELELKRRAGAGVETRSVTPDQTELPPDGKTRYTLDLPVQDYISARFLRVVAGDNRAEVPFKALPGAARPPLESPAAKTIIVNRPAPKGEEFINTPNNPGRVP